MNGYPPPMGTPPTPWRTVKTADGKEYYHNTITNATAWEKPDELRDEVDRAITGTGWAIQTAADGKRYFYHTETRETTWSIPDAVQANIDSAKASQPPPQFAPPPAAWSAGPMVPHPEFRRERDEYRPDHRREHRDRDRDRYDHHDRDRDFGGDRPSLSFAPPPELQFSTPQEAEAAFMKVLKSMKAQPDWTWAQVMRHGVTDPNWRAIPESENRQLAFNKYCEELRASEKQKEQDRQIKLRADFTAMLQSHPEIKHYTRWNTALPIIQDESIFRSAKDDAERKQYFNEYIASLKKAHKKEEADNCESALEKVMGLLEQLDLGPFTRWQTAEAQLQENEQFRNELSHSLPRVKVLEKFVKHIRQLQFDHNERTQAERNVITRIERKNRDKFKELLEEVRRDGVIRHNTKWKDIRPLIENDPRYIAMLGQQRRGSSSIDLFRDVVESEESKFRTLRRHALEVLEKEQFQVDPSTPIEEFINVMKKDRGTANIDDQTMPEVFQYVLDKRQKQEEELHRQEEQKERNAIDKLRSYIKHLEPAVDIGATWETVRPRVEDSDEYRALRTDDLRRAAFDKHMDRIVKDAERRDRRRDDTRRDDTRRDDRDRDRDRREREYRNGHTDRRHRTRSPEHDSYAAERRRAQQDREARYRHDAGGLSPRRRDRRDSDHYGGSRRARTPDHYVRERRERETERERLYVSRADPREGSVNLDYGDGGGRPTTSSRRRRESNESAVRDNKRPRYSPRAEAKVKDPAPEPVSEDRALRSGSEEGEIEED